LLEDLPAGVKSPWAALGLAQVKPHGSINWQRLVRVPASEGSPERLIQEAGHYQTTDDFTLRSGSSTGKAGLPAVAVPTLRKSIFECPPIHLQVLQEQLPKVDRVLVIGWRAQEETFLDLIREHGPNWVVGLIR
jgi:hypothetical protein